MVTTTATATCRCISSPAIICWARQRRVVAKAEYLDKGENPRFVVTSLDADRWQARELYEQFYCQRGEMENRIKEQMCLFAYRLAPHGR